MCLMIEPSVRRAHVFEVLARVGGPSTGDQSHRLHIRVSIYVQDIPLCLEACDGRIERVRACHLKDKGVKTVATDSSGFGGTNAANLLELGTGKMRPISENQIRQLHAP